MMMMMMAVGLYFCALSDRDIDKFHPKQLKIQSPPTSPDLNIPAS